MDNDFIIAQLNDCWNKIGTWGEETPRCERLTDVGHCSKCDVYQRAGRIALQRPAPQGYLEEWRKFLAAKPSSASANGRFFVLFELGIQLYALPTSALEQVADASPIRTLPHNRRPALLGVVNVRGDVLPCVDLAALLDSPVGATTRSAVAYRRLLVIEPSSARWVLPVARVVGLQRVEPGQLSEDLFDENTLLQGKAAWGERAVHVVNVERLAQRLEDFKL